MLIVYYNGAGGAIPAGSRGPPASLPGAVGGNQPRQRRHRRDDNRTSQVRRDQQRAVATTRRLPEVRPVYRRQPFLRGDYATHSRLSTEPFRGTGNFRNLRFSSKLYMPVVVVLGWPNRNTDVLELRQ